MTGWTSVCYPGHWADGTDLNVVLLSSGVLTTLTKGIDEVTCDC